MGETAGVLVSTVLAEFGAASRTEAVAIAHREGLLEPAAGAPDRASRTRGELTRTATPGEGARTRRAKARSRLLSAPEG
ncbi:MULTISPECIES: hypothetical protein [unclassified Streptomyces]|uniref:hypothetical protein n=1 Tax=unclassified Streptomyces TaxID=2593676 RepID=UPI00131F1F62|nr:MULTISPECIES: hypothetical protein [unclassified Streptomyces]